MGSPGGVQAVIQVFLINNNHLPGRPGSPGNFATFAQRDNRPQWERHRRGETLYIFNLYIYMDYLDHPDRPFIFNDLRRPGTVHAVQAHSCCYRQIRGQFSTLYPLPYSKSLNLRGV